MPKIKEPKMLDPIRHPKVQGRYESLARGRYDKMLTSMVRMLAIGLSHHMKK